MTHILTLKETDHEHLTLWHINPSTKHENVCPKSLRIVWYPLELSLSHHVSDWSSHLRLRWFFLFHFIILTSWSVHSSQLHVKYQAILRTPRLTSELFVSLRREILRKSINISKELKKTRQVRQYLVTVSHRGDPYANKSQREKEHGNEKDLGHASLQRQGTLL